MWIESNRKLTPLIPFLEIKYLELVDSALINCFEKKVVL